MKLLLKAIELTNDRYKMQDLYPARYQTMTEVPDKLDTSKLTTAEEMFNGCKNLSKLYMEYKIKKHIIICKYST